MNRLGRILTVIVIIGVIGAPLAHASPVSAQSTAVFVTVQTSTTPDQPTTEEEFDLDFEISSAEGGTNNAYVKRVSLVNSTETPRERYDTEHSLGQISPGSSLQDSLSVDIDEEGTYDLYLDLFVYVAGETYHVYEPVTIRVYDGHPVIDASAAEAMAGTYTDLELSVGNGLETSIRNVELTLDSPEVDVQQPRRVTSQIAAGDTQSYNFRAAVESAGENEIEATLQYTNDSGERRHITRSVTVEFTEPEFADDVSVGAQVKPTMPGSQTKLNLTVSNGLDVALRQLQLSVAGEEVSIPQPERVDGQIASGEQRTYQFNVRKNTSGSQTFEATISYITENGNSRTIQKSLQTSFIKPENPGRVTLTGLQVEKAGDTLTVSGTASNVGGNSVSGVTVAVDSNTDIAPGRSQSDYFVGSIPASDFVSFDVNAELLTNTTSATVPIRVTYTVDGVQQQQIHQVAYEEDQSEPVERTGPSLPTTPIIAGVVVLLVVIGGVWFWRRR